MTLWMAVDADKFELPIAVADSAPELADYLGTSVRQVRLKRWRDEQGETRGMAHLEYKIFRLEVD